MNANVDGPGERSSQLGTLMASNQTEIDESRSTAGYSYLFGRFHLRVAENSRMTLFSDGHAVPLSVVESTILRELLEKRGQFIKTDDLLKCVSPSSTASENLIHGAVRGLRRTLNDADLIRSERSKGYCFTGAVERKPVELPDEILSEPVPAMIEPVESDEIHPGDSLSPAALTVSGDNRPVTREATLDAGRNPFVVVALLVSAPVVLLPFGLVFFGGNWESLPKQLGFIQALMILVAIGYDFYFSDNRESRDADTETRRALVAARALVPRGSLPARRPVRPRVARRPLRSRPASGPTERRKEA